jgi:NADPH2:quinone reductase
LSLKPRPPQGYPLPEELAAPQSLADGGVLGKVALEP